MRILAIESSGLFGGVAALDERQLLAELPLAAGQRSARALAPAIADLLKQVAWRPRDVELVAVTVGPGSFTGLRVGVTTAKMFAYAVGGGVFGVHTLEAIALRAGLPGGARVRAVLDAQRQELFACEYEIDVNGRPQPLGETRLVDADAWLRELAAGAVVTGPAVAKLKDRLPPGVTAISSERSEPTAATVGVIAFERHAAGERHDLWQLVPQYYRRSAAEEKLDSKAAKD